MKKLSTVTAIVCLLAGVACGQPPNPQIGTWISIPAPGMTTIPYCAWPMVFTGTTQTLTYSGKQAPTEQVNYIAAQTATYPTTVYVTGNTSANHQTYVFSGKDAMVYDSAANCHYKRQ